MAKAPDRNIGNDVRHFTSEMKKYAENKVKLAILNAGERLSRAIADSTGKIAALLLLGIAFLYLLVALALFVGNILHNLVLGFVVASGPGLIAGLFIFILAPSKIARKMQDKIVEQVVNDIDFNSGPVMNGHEAEEDQLTNKKTEG